MIKLKNLVYSFFLALLPIVHCFSQSSPAVEYVSLKEITLLTDSVSAVLSRTYVYPQKVAGIVQKLKTNLKNGAYNKVKSKRELGEQLAVDLLKASKDKHLKMGYVPGAAIHDPVTASDSIEKKFQLNRLKTSKENNFSFKKKEILPGNVGYLRWDDFDEFTEEALSTFDSSFQAVSRCKALIIDMRYNLGGNAALVDEIQNYFFERKTAMNHIITRQNDTIKRYSDPIKTSFKLTMPVYILTSHVTFSAGEDFSYSLQQAKRAMVIGDTTGGGAHPVQFNSLGQGFVITVPARRAFNENSKTNWEGVGIIPNITVASDEALTTTLLKIYEHDLRSTKDIKEKKKIESYIADAKRNKHLAIPFRDIQNSDAKNAIEIKDSIYGPTNVGRGFGSVREIHIKTSYLDKGAPVYINEVNSAWFKLRFAHDTLLSFDIVPTDPLEDYDFVFFRCPDENCIEQLKTNKLVIDRQCYSGFPSYNGATGLSEYGANNPVGLGPGPTYVRSLPVKAGELYYLMVDIGEAKVKEGIFPSGFTIYFHNYWPKKKIVTLNNIFFNSNKATLMEKSFSELDKLVIQLNAEKKMNIEIKGHADSEGNEAKNLELSEQRANAVKAYLVSKGISDKRIVSKGFGSSRPVAPDSTEEGRQKNRRVEFGIIMR